jgi:hypothetical protein
MVTEFVKHPVHLIDGWFSVALPTSSQNRATVKHSYRYIKKRRHLFVAGIYFA